MIIGSVSRTSLEKFFTEIEAVSSRAQVEVLSLPPGVEKGLTDTLIPGLYIKRAASPAKTAEDRRRLSENHTKFLYHYKRMTIRFMVWTRKR